MLNIEENAWLIQHHEIDIRGFSPQCCLTTGHKH